MKTITKILSITIIFISTSSIINAGDWNKLLNLKGWWKFSIGDDKQWASQYFRDKDWEEIRVPSQWEDQGFYGYDGYAWYRKHFFCSSDFKGKSIYLSVGYIDDVDEVYLNGTLIGTTGSFPPDYNTAYNSFRKYYIPENLLKFNSDNVIAVRVYDSQMGGGIVSGDVGFFYQANSLPADVVLEGVWKFRTGDNMQWADKNYNDTEWGKIFVPGYWENQGYNEYDGFVWYRKKFYLDNDLLNKKLVLMVGKIDDLDEVYVNGKLVGSTGQMRPKYGKIQFNDEYSRFRGYYLPDNLLVKGENTIAVRVYDGYNVGGIYEGPVGIISQEKYTKFWRTQKKSKSFWEVFFGNE
jgi:hypothetical protein